MALAQEELRARDASQDQVKGGKRERTRTWTRVVSGSCCEFGAEPRGRHLELGYLLLLGEQVGRVLDVRQALGLAHGALELALDRLADALAALEAVLEAQDGSVERAALVEERGGLCDAGLARRAGEGRRGREEGGEERVELGDEGVLLGLWQEPRVSRVGVRGAKGGWTHAVEEVDEELLAEAVEATLLLPRVGELARGELALLMRCCWWLCHARCPARGERAGVGGIKR